MLHLLRKWPRAMLAGLVVGLGAAGALPGVAAAAPRHHAGYVYVDDNTAGVNTIAGFRQRVDGTLVPLPGSPFSAGGAGTGSGLASQGAIQVSSDRHYVLAVDARSNEISVLRIRRHGGLRLVDVASSGGVTPVSLTEHDGLVYVANAGAGGSSYAGFTLSPDGQLSPLAGSRFALPDSAQPGDVLFNSTGTHLAGSRVGTSQIDSFRVSRDGRLIPAPGSPFAAQGAGPFGSEFRPTHPTQLFVSNAHDGPGKGTVSAWGVAHDGTLTPIGSSPFADLQTAPCWVEISHDGRFLFTVNTAADTISRYAISPGGSLTLLGSTPVVGGSGTGSVDARLSRDGRTLYVNESRIRALGEFAVSGGQLAPLGAAALPSGAAAAGLAVK